MTSDSPMDARLLDRIAAKRAQNIVDLAVGGDIEPKDVDNLITKALGVLQENGVYACFLFLLSRSREKDAQIAGVTWTQLLALAADDLPYGWGQPGSPDTSAILIHVSDTICADLDPLLMTKEIFEQTLIYTRYGAKAHDKQGR